MPGPHWVLVSVGNRLWGLAKQRLWGPANAGCPEESDGGTIRSRHQNTTIATTRYYAIVGGAGDFNGVVTNWEQQAKPLTKRVSGVQHKRFATVEAATQFVTERSGIPGNQVQVIAYAPQLQVPPRQPGQQVVAAAPAPGEQGGAELEQNQ